MTMNKVTRRLGRERCSRQENLQVKRGLDFVYDTHGHGSTQWNPTVVSPAALQIYSDAVAAKGAA